MTTQHEIDHQPANGEGAHGTQRLRPTLGLQALALDRKQPVWLGAADAARKHDVNLICFAGEPIREPGAGDAGMGDNALYDLLSAESLDGLVMWAGQGVAVTRYLTPNQLDEFLSRFSALPVVNLEGTLPGVPCVLTDTAAGMREVLAHLIQVHGCQRILLIRGPEGHFETQERVRAYAEILANYGLPLDPNLISPSTGQFGVERGAAIMAWLLDERKLRPNLDFDAVAATESEFSHGALKVLQTRGIRVPADVAVVGFNDYLEDWAVTPPLTTVRKPFYEAGQRAVELLLERLAGRTVPDQVNVPAALVVRQSCGCLSPAVVQAAIGPVAPADEPLEAVSGARWGHLLAEMEQAAGESSPGSTHGWAAQLLDAFSAEVRGEADGVFLRALDEVLQHVVAAGSEVGVWHRVLSVLRRHTLPFLLSRPETLSRANDLWEQSQVMLGETAQRAQIYAELQVEEQTATLRRNREALSVTLDIGGLMDVLADGLPRLGIPSCYLALYEPGREWARLVLAYTEQGRIELQEGGPRFRSQQLAPEGVLPQSRPYTLIAQALHIQADQLGFVLFELGPREGWIYHALRGQISNAVQAVLLTEQLKNRALQLQAAAEVARIMTSILDIDELLPRIVHLIGERFGYYHVALFVIDQSGEWAVLRAMTGEVSQQLIGEVRLRVGGQGIVGQVGQTRQPHVAQAVEHDPLYVPLAVLPHTRAEAAFPLLSGEALTGILDVQSDQTNAFPDHVVSILTTLADQIAVAIQNAWLHAAEKEHARDLERAYGTLRENQEKLLIAEKMASLGRLAAGIAHEMNTPLAAIRMALIELDRLVAEYQSGLGDAAVTRDDHEAIARDMQQTLRLANNAAERAASFVRSIKVQARDLTPADREPLNAAAVIQDALLVLRHALIKGKCTVSFDCDGEVPELYGSPGRLAQVVTHLVMNAIEASAPRGGGPILIRLSSGRQGLELQVQDHGTGIPPENLPKIFDPMFTTKPFGEATGLGLTLVHDIVKSDFEGTIHVQSEIDKGTTFTITFPHLATTP